MFNFCYFRTGINRLLLMPFVLYSGTREMSKNALRNKKRREKQKEKKAAEGSAVGGNDD